MPNSSNLRLTSPAGVSADFDRGSIYFVGTATVILRYAGFTILTDPNFLHAGDHVHLGYGLTAERLTNPALEIEQLPPIDFCVLSHYHGDHFDRIAEQKLRKDLHIITTEHAAAELSDKGFTAPLALSTWDSVVVEKGDARVQVTSMPGKHGPPIVDKFLPPVMGSMLEFQPAGGRTALRLYITGDTLVHDDLNEIPRRYPDIDLALFHLGGTQIMGILLTMDAEQGVEAIRIINPREVIPIHYNDYEVFKSPLEDFKKAVAAAGFSERVRYLSHGETYEFDVAATRRQEAGR
ncbi:MAG TPA: MBL fold metallo-hydrolase [Pyrinomonadaceae bacterium]|jgi:L-ascorbate metabolism protein UlaG (beta-lactamase superfamily)|nr:MBL fold metallo-hydrolase [Pyrinomonadaceae bacterium]